MLLAVGDQVHFEAAEIRAEDRTIILIGHKDHQEIIGTSGEAPDRTIVVDSWPRWTTGSQHPRQTGFLTRRFLYARIGQADSIAGQRATTLLRTQIAQKRSLATSLRIIRLSVVWVRTRVCRDC